MTLDLSRAPTLPRAATKPNLAGLTRAELAQVLVAAEVVRPEKARMRASQLWRWIHHYGVTDFALMSDVAKEMRAARDRRAASVQGRHAQVVDPHRAGH